MKNKNIKLGILVITLVGAYLFSSIGFSGQEMETSKKSTLKTKKGLNLKSKKSVILKEERKEKSEEIKRQVSLSDHQRVQMIEEFIDRSGTVRVFEALRENLNTSMEGLPQDGVNEKQKRIRLKLVNLINQLLDPKGIVEGLNNDLKEGNSDNILSKVNELYKRPVMEKMVSESELKLSSPDFFKHLNKKFDGKEDISEIRIQLYKDLEKSGTENEAERNHLMETFQKDMSLSFAQILVSEMPADQKPSVEVLKKRIGQEFEKNRVNEEKETININHYLYKNLTYEELKEIIDINNKGSVKKLNDKLLKILIENFKRKSS